MKSFLTIGRNTPMVSRNSKMEIPCLFQKDFCMALLFSSTGHLLRKNWKSDGSEFCHAARLKNAVHAVNETAYATRHCAKPKSTMPLRGRNSVGIKKIPTRLSSSRRHDTTPDAHKKSMSLCTAR